MRGLLSLLAPGYFQAISEESIMFGFSKVRTKYFDCVDCSITKSLRSFFVIFGMQQLWFVSRPAYAYAVCDGFAKAWKY